MAQQPWLPKLQPVAVISISTGKIDKRTLTDVQRATLGLPLKGRHEKRAKRKSTDREERELETLGRDIATGKIKPAAERLVDQLREMLGKWAERGIR